MLKQALSILETNFEDKILINIEMATLEEAYLNIAWNEEEIIKS